jgi:hypothetical protein
MVEVDVKERGAAGLYRLAQRPFHHLGLVEMMRVPEVDEEVGAGVVQAVPSDEIILPLFLGLRSSGVGRELVDLVMPVCRIGYRGLLVGSRTQKRDVRCQFPPLPGK